MTKNPTDDVAVCYVWSCVSYTEWLQEGKPEENTLLRKRRGSSRFQYLLKKPACERARTGQARGAQGSAPPALGRAPGACGRARGAARRAQKLRRVAGGGPPGPRVEGRARPCPQGRWTPGSESSSHAGQAPHLGQAHTLPAGHLEAAAMSPAADHAWRLEPLPAPRAPPCCGPRARACRTPAGPRSVRVPALQGGRAQVEGGPSRPFL